MSVYTTLIREAVPGYDPDQVEAWMRLEHPTLDGLDLRSFRREARLAAKCIDAEPELSKQLASV